MKTAAGTALALVVAVALGGIALDTPANAVAVGQVWVTDYPANGSRSAVWKGAWGLAWKKCREKSSEGRSIEMVKYEPYNDEGGWFSLWNCRSTK